MSEEGKTDYFHYLADDLMKVKRYDDAIILYEKLVDMHPGEDSFLLSLAWAYHDTGRLDDAIECFEQLLSVELKREVFTGFAFDELVRLFRENGQYNRLVDVCEKVVAAQQDDIALLSDLGDAYLKAGRASEAVAVFERIVEVEPDASAAYCNLGNALVTTGDFDGAEEAYRKAVEIDPQKLAPFTTSWLTYISLLDMLAGRKWLSENVSNFGLMSLCAIAALVMSSSDWERLTKLRTHMIRLSILIELRQLRITTGLETLSPWRITIFRQ